MELANNVELPEYALQVGEHNDILLTAYIRLQIITEAREPHEDDFEYSKELHYPCKAITITKMLIRKDLIEPVRRTAPGTE